MDIKQAEKIGICKLTDSQFEEYRQKKYAQQLKGHSGQARHKHRRSARQVVRQWVLHRRDKKAYPAP